MDFKTLITTPNDLATQRGDALVVVLPVDKSQWRLPKALADVVQDAVKQGDLELKAGKTLYLHRPAGVTAPRVVASVAANGEPKAFRAAVVAALGPLKGTGVKQLVVAWAGQDEPGAAQAEALVAAAADAVYVYRHTKPSAPAAWFTIVIARKRSRRRSRDSTASSGSPPSNSITKNTVPSFDLPKSVTSTMFG